MATDTRRLTILSSEEISSLYDLPRFSEDERPLYFDLSAAERDAVFRIHTTASAIHLALQLGYFKAKRRFFIYDPEIVADDLTYVVRHLFAGKEIASFKALSKPTRLEQQRIILQLFNYRLADQEAKSELEQKAQRFAMLSTQPIYIMREVLQYLENRRIVIPGYTFLQDMVGRAVTRERNRITDLLAQALSPATKDQLDALLQADEQVYRISALKREAKDFSYKELRQEVERRRFFQPLHEFARTFLGTAGLSVESGKYYASLVKFYTVYKLQRMAQGTTRLYLLCFAFHRFRLINDNLIEAFIHLVHQYEKLAKRAAEEAMQKAMVDAAEHLQAAGQVLSLFTDTSIPDEAPFMAVKEQAFTLLEREQFPVVSDYLRNIAFDKVGFEWAYYTTLSFQFKRNLRHLFCELDFAGRVEDTPLMEAVIFLQELLRQGKSPRQTNGLLFPREVIPKSLQRYLFIASEKAEEGDEVDAEKRLDADRYEFLLYRLLRNALEAGNLFVKDSVEFRRFEDDLISDERWQ